MPLKMLAGLAGQGIAEYRKKKKSNMSPGMDMKRSPTGSSGTDPRQRIPMSQRPKTGPGKRELVPRSLMSKVGKTRRKKK